MDAKIYKIKSNNDNNDIYIGSTIRDLSDRYSGHKSYYKMYKSDSECKGKYLSSFKMFDKHGLENCYIEEIKQLSNVSKSDILKEESHAIKDHREKGFNVINHMMPYIPEEEKAERAKQAMSKYRENNRELYNKRLREFMNKKYKNNVEYREKHSRAMLEKYYLKNEIKKLMAIEIS